MLPRTCSQGHAPKDMLLRVHQDLLDLPCSRSKGSTLQCQRRSSRGTTIKVTIFLQGEASQSRRYGQNGSQYFNNSGSNLHTQKSSSLTPRALISLNRRSKSSLVGICCASCQNCGHSPTAKRSGGTYCRGYQTATENSVLFSEYVSMLMIRSTPALSESISICQKRRIQGQGPKSLGQCPLLRHAPAIVMISTDTLLPIERMRCDNATRNVARSCASSMVGLLAGFSTSVIGSKSTL
mmetsp:Transcript_6072/g.13828  ORF Transcript_6072/g.13828 Transcript_6072/m.13828 type:complete len:238 (-) Transcript_6072:427-1140(-)